MVFHPIKFFLMFYIRARVDVHRKDNVGSVEKAITIYGQPENCTNACHQVPAKTRYGIKR